MIKYILNAKTLAEITNGIWSEPQDNEWFATGLCTWEPVFRQGHLLVGREDDAVPGGLKATKVLELSNKGASAILTSAPEMYAHLGLPILTVQDNVKAIIAIGKWFRAQYSGTVIGITGSVGKTSTVAMLNQALSSYGGVSQTERNLNVLIGIASIMSGFNQNDSYWLLEMALGEMLGNSEVVKPDIAIVTSISEAHTAEVPTLEGIAEQKSLIFEHMQPNSHVIINRDIEQFEIIEKKAKSKNLSIITYGYSDNSEIRLKNITTSNVKIEIRGKEYNYKTTLPDHLIINSLAVLGVMLALQLPIEAAIKKIEIFQPLPGRGLLRKVKFNDKDISVISDAFNASPKSMRAGLRYLEKTAPQPSSRVAILGEMAELGEESTDLHINLKDVIKEIQPDRILLCGKQMKHLWDVIKIDYKGVWYENSSQILPEINNWLRAGDVVYVKGSGSTQLSKVVLKLINS